MAIVQALRALQQQAQNSDDCQILACIIGCILACIQGIIEYFNKFAFIYVGLYGYSFIDAGRNVITLFQNKGWTTIITDDLSDNVLWLMSIGIALASGLVGFVMGAANQAMFSGIGYDQNGGTVGFMYVTWYSVLPFNVTFGVLTLVYTRLSSPLLASDSL